jgi:hypothetical protein
MNTCGSGRAKFQIWCPVTTSAEQFFAQNIWCECRQSTRLGRSNAPLPHVPPFVIAAFEHQVLQRAVSS